MFSLSLLLCVSIAPLVHWLMPSQVLRSRFISCVHRMVECLGASLLPMLPAALEVLLTTQVRAAGEVQRICLSGVKPLGLHLPITYSS